LNSFNQYISENENLRSPDKTDQRELYSKKYLLSDEEEFFVSGQNLNSIKHKDTNIRPGY